jgi:hypothetical protein
MAFGDPTEPHHSEALSIVAQTEEAIAAVLGRDDLLSADDAARTARIVSAIMFLSMAANANPALRTEDIVQDISTQIRLLLPRWHQPSAIAARPAACRPELHPNQTGRVVRGPRVSVLVVRGRPVLIRVAGSGCAGGGGALGRRVLAGW